MKGEGAVSSTEADPLVIRMRTREGIKVAKAKGRLGGNGLSPRQRRTASRPSGAARRCRGRAHDQVVLRRRSSSVPP